MNKKNKKKIKKDTAKNGSPQQHQQKNFLKLVSDASLKTVKPFIKTEVEILGQGLQREQGQTLSALVNRLVVLENIVVEKLGFSMDELGDKVAEHLEMGDDIDILIWYEYFFDRDVSGIELDEDDFDNMFHQLSDLLAHDYDKGELTKIMEAMELAYEQTYCGTFEKDGEWIYKFEGQSDDS